MAKTIKIEIVSDIHGIYWRLTVNGERVNAKTVDTVEEAFTQAADAYKRAL